MPTAGLKTRPTHRNVGRVLRPGRVERENYRLQDIRLEATSFQPPASSETERPRQRRFELRAGS
jgi:hypothetical protein